MVRVGDAGMRDSAPTTGKHGRRPAGRAAPVAGCRLSRSFGGVGGILHTDMVSVADEPILHLTVKEWEEYVAGDPSAGGVRLKLRQ